MDYKLGFGPMSDMIVDILLDYARDRQRPLMIIASRNQVDAYSGYVMTTEQLQQKHSRKFYPDTLLCRDHCGPFFLDSERALSESQALEATKHTIAHDIENGFSLIHIDTSRCTNPYKSAEELVNFTLSLMPTMYLEFGTEENIGVAAGVKKYMEDVRFACQFPNTKFVVAQTGSLTYEDRQAGTFEFDSVRHLVEYAEANGIGLKEHNADYLSADQLRMRRQAGVHACNIAPQLGVLQTQAIIKLADYYNVSTNDFRQTVLNSNKWAKWTDSTDSDLRVRVAGHYCFNTDSYRRLEEQLYQLCNVRLVVEKAVSGCLDLYYTVLY